MDQSSVRHKKIVQTSLIGIAVNLLLAAFKAVIGALSGSVAILLDAVNNLSDALSSVITIIGTRLAGKNPDKKHPYGYGQIEYISSVTISILILMAGLTSFKESFEKILHPETADYTVTSLVIIAAAVLAKYFLGRYVKGQGKKYNSESLIASGTDALFDSLISLSTLVGGIVSMVWGISIDGWLGVMISIIILKSGVEVLFDSLNGIIGARVESELSTRLKEQLTTYPKVLGAYDLILNRYGPEKIIGSVHIEVPDQMSAREIHGLTRAMAEDVYEKYGIILTIGIYASNTSSQTEEEIKKKLLELVAQEPDILQMHGFYVDEPAKVISFDLIVDFKSDHPQQILQNIASRMKELYPDYQFSAILDSDYSD